MNTLASDWDNLDRLAQGEYGISLSQTLADANRELAFNRIGRLFGVYLKEPFALSFPYDPDLPINWAKAHRCWEIHEAPPGDVLIVHQTKLELLEQLAQEWNRPLELLAEFNVFLSLCRRFKPLVCGEAKALENSEKIAKDLEKQGISVSSLSLNQGLGIAATTIATYLAQGVPNLSAHSPIVTGLTLLLLCYGQRRVCALMTTFEAKYDEKKDRFATREFYVCGATSTRDGTPCERLVRAPGLRCARHA